MSELDGGTAEPLDEAGLAGAFATHRDRLWRTVRVRLDRRLVGRVDPDDVLQEAFLDASRRLGHYRPGEASIFLWVRMVVGQTLADMHRRHLGSAMRDAGREVDLDFRGGEYPRATSSAMAHEFVADLTTPSKVAIRAEMAARLEEALEGMNPMDREVLVLRHFEELTNGEVAQVLGLGQKAASIRYVRAVARLKGILAQFPEFSEESR